MRISTLTMYNQSVTSINRQQGDFLKIGQQIATGRRLLTPADDPQAATKALGVAQSKAVAEQYGDARVGARSALTQQESVLNSISDALVRTKSLMVQAANATLSDADRASIASEMRGVMEMVLGQANATDGNGHYLFGGYRDNSPPFVRDVSGSVVYVGDSNDRQVRIDASRLMEAADSGDGVFLAIQSGAGYVAEADAANSGSATFVGPRVVDSSDPGFGAAYDISFSVVGTDTSYSINGGPPVTYQPGVAVTFGGLSMTFEGVPADGDSLTVDKASQMNTNLFATFEKVIATLETPAQTDAQKASLANTISTSMREFDNSFDNILTVRASSGARLNELDALDLVEENRILNYQQTLSELVDLDYVEAISDYTLRQVGLQAAQKTFVDINKLSLFNLL
ncbi:flagellar hook-associated protein FlgL [Porticoccus sp.]